MIQWIALAVAVDASSTADNANEKAEMLSHQSKGVNSPLVIIHYFDLVYKSVKARKTLWQNLFGPVRQVLSDKPSGKFSLRKTDLLNFREYEDDDGAPYVRICISEYAKVRAKSGNILIGVLVPGTLEQVTKAIGGVG